MRYFYLILFSGIIAIFPPQLSACNGSGLTVDGPTSVPRNTSSNAFEITGFDDQATGNINRNYLVEIEFDPGITVSGSCHFIDPLDREATLTLNPSGTNKVETDNTVGIGTFGPFISAGSFIYPRVNLDCDITVTTSSGCGTKSFETRFKREGSTFQSEIQTFNVPCPPPPPSVTLEGPDAICRTTSIDDPFFLVTQGGVTLSSVNFSASNGVNLLPFGDGVFVSGVGSATSFTVTATFFRSDEPGVLQTLTKSATVLNCLEAPTDSKKDESATNSAPATVDIEPITKSSVAAQISKLYPIPAGAFVFVPVNCQSSGSAITLTDALGRPQRALSTKAAGNHRIDLNGLPKGTYYVSVDNSCGRSLQQLIIK